ncbi:hypothetical protein OQJ13_00885 [Legionella sp. PATHC035]|uniref:hypothetical protein n=1 Tax=Legionella sp. PATHC035 TaxID=2992040 RepID=UPI0022432FBB|nr:hypothetical protein [Legionella sp. PATHC035]MCW8407527.1 hypothetical protein [Legionella sp. PATHC035]
MKNQFFEQKIFNNMDAPMQKLMELNVKMMQNLSLLKPMDLFNIKRPEEFFNKNMELFIQNSQMTMDYMRETFNILERHWLNISRDMDQHANEMMNETSSLMTKSTKKVATTTKTAAKKAVSTVKKVSSSAKKAATSAAKKVSSPTKKAASPAAQKTSSLAKKAAAPAAKKVSSSAKMANAKKNAKATTSQSKTTPAVKAKQEARKPESKPAMMHSTAPISHNSPINQPAAKPGMSSGSNMSQVGASGVKDINIQNIGKDNPMPNQFPK